MVTRALIFAILFGVNLLAIAPQQADDADQPVRTPAQNPNAVAVVIGIGEYQNTDVPKVDFAVNDAEAVRRVLTQTLGYPEARVLFRTNSQASTGRLKPLIRQELRSRVTAGQSDVFVYYSGHGAPNADTREGYLIPWDYDPQYIPSSDSAYSLKELYTDLAGLGARSVTVVLEACFSGVSDSDNGTKTITRDASPLNIVVENPAQTLTNGVVISASGGREIATWYRDRRHGLMTYYWLLAMRGEAGDAQGRVTPDGMKRYLQEKVPQKAQELRGRRQTPDVIALNDDRVLAQLPQSALKTGDARIVQKFGSLEISIDLGGDLRIDGIAQGTIPAGSAFVQDKVSAGPHQIEIRKDGYQPIQEQIVITADRLTQKEYRFAANLPNPVPTPTPAPRASAPAPAPEPAPLRIETPDERRISETIRALGVGRPASKNASLQVQRQEAFIAAFCDALGVMAALNDDRIGATKTIGEFQVTSGFGETTVIYKGQKIVVSDNVLKTPLEGLDFPNWSSLGRRFGGVEIENGVEAVQTDGVYQINLSYSPAQ